MKFALRPFCAALLLLSLCAINVSAQEYAVRAVDAANGKPLAGIPITLRYDCTFTGSASNPKAHCKFIQRKTDSNGVAHFPEAGRIKEIDDIFSLPIEYGMVCCDIPDPKIPGTGTMTFKRRSVREMLQWIFVGD